MISLLTFVILLTSVVLDFTVGATFTPSKYAHQLVKNCELRNNFSDDKYTLTEIKVGIIGSGISGMYAALLLQDLDISYEILEATSRIGGRYHTSFFDVLSKYNYIELGAMRFPLTPEYDRLVGYQNWSLINYLNTKLKKRSQLRLINFIPKHQNNIFHFNGKSKLRSEVESNGDLFGFGKSNGGLIDDDYTVKNASFWKIKAFDYIQRQLSANESSSYGFLLKNDFQTFRRFLMDENNTELSYPSVVVDWIENFLGMTGAFSYSFMDAYLDPILLTEKMVTIDGGISTLVDSIKRVLQVKPKLRNVVRRIKQEFNNNINVTTNRGQYQYNHVIVTPTFPVLRDIEFDCELRLKTRNAMRDIINTYGLKVALQFKTRFWENEKLMNGKPIFGGESLTDLRIRRIVYPSYGINCSDCYGTLLAMYTLYRDAEKFMSIHDPDDIVAICLEDLSRIHGEIVIQQFTGKYRIMNWNKYKWTQGPFATFDPGYFASYYPYLIYPDGKGRIHFAGDTLSVYHSWSIGAVTSAYRAVKDILTIQGMTDKLNKLETNWGKISEPDLSDFQ